MKSFTIMPTIEVKRKEPFAARLAYTCYSNVRQFCTVGPFGLADISADVRL
jgi:hypothetical protein